MAPCNHLAAALLWISTTATGNCCQKYGAGRHPRIKFDDLFVDAFHANNTEIVIDTIIGEITDADGYDFSKCSRYSRTSTTTP